MKYNDLYADFCEVFKDDISTIKIIQSESLVLDDDGMHVIFGMVITPFVIKLITDNNSPKIQIAFDFFERMATSGSPEICEVLEFSVLENLISTDLIVKCKKYMLSETLKSCEKLENWSL